MYPSFLRMLATASQPEPSANAPCTRTTFLIFVMVYSPLQFEIDPRIKVGAPNISALAGFCRFCCFLSEDGHMALPGMGSANEDLASEPVSDTWRLSATFHRFVRD